MADRIGHEVQPGGLGAVHHRQIFEMAETGLKASQIARKLRKHPSTVGWFMYQAGLRPPRSTDVALEFVRNGRTVRRFSRDEDAFITSLRVKEVDLEAIARRATERFGHRRTRHTVRCRLIMLAGQEDAADG